MFTGKQLLDWIKSVSERNRRAVTHTIQVECCGTRMALGAWHWLWFDYRQEHYRRHYYAEPSDQLKQAMWRDIITWQKQ